MTEATTRPVTDSEIPDRAPRVTPADLEASITEVVYLSPGNYLRPGHPAALLTLCILVLDNGFTVVGKSACASPENFDVDIGRRLAMEDAKRQLWSFLGFRLRDRLAHGEAVAGAIRRSEAQ